MRSYNVRFSKTSMMRSRTFQWMGLMMARLRGQPPNVHGGPSSRFGSGCYSTPKNRSWVWEKFALRACWGVLAQVQEVAA